jgi:hypothetical protein
MISFENKSVEPEKDQTSNKICNDSIDGGRKMKIDQAD